MLRSIELRNFQSHKHTVIDFDKGLNVLLGESDNGKTAVIRAIRWVLENRPLGTDKLNSRWNEKFDDEMSVTLTTDDGWVRRIRTKERNGYDVCIDGNVKELFAVGTDVPRDVKEFLRMSDVNLQMQMNAPYLLSMTNGEASKYLNEIVHLDSIDGVLANADSNKRSIAAETKVCQSDINKTEKLLEQFSWVEEASKIQSRIDKYDELITRRNGDISDLSLSLTDYKSESSKILDFTEQKELVSQIENIDIVDYSEFEGSIGSYKDFERNILDLSAQKDLVSEIEGISSIDYTELEDSLLQYKSLIDEMKHLEDTTEELRKSLPDTCPYCGSSVGKEGMHVHN